MSIRAKVIINKFFFIFLNYKYNRLELMVSAL